MKKFNFLLSFLVFFLLISCETVRDWTDDIGTDEEFEDLESSEQSLISDEGIKEFEEDEIIVRRNGTQENEQLPATPTQDYDSTLLGEDVQNNGNSLDLAPTNDSTVKDNNQKELSIIEQRKLQISDKIQYRVATINFNSGSSSVDSRGLKKTKKIAKMAKERDAKIKVVGHASKRTKDMPISQHKIINFKISDQRAQSVAKIFIDKYNFPESNLITEAVSDSKPLFQENMPAGTKANQRTEIFIIY